MDILESAKKEIEQFPKIVDETIRRTFENYKGELVDYQINRQWFEAGEKNDGDRIRPLNKDYEVYSQFTIRKKRAKGQPTDRITLKDTGKLHRSITIKVLADRLLIETNDPTFNKVEAQYGEGLLGIQDRYLREFVENRLLIEIKKALKI